MSKVYFEQVFRRVKTGSSGKMENNIQDTTIRFEVTSTDEKTEQCVERARRLLKQSPGLRFRSGWTSWVLRENRFVDENLEEILVNVEIPADEPVMVNEEINQALLAEAENSDGEGAVTLDELVDVLPETEEIFEPVGTIELPEISVTGREEPEKPAKPDKPEKVAPHVRGDAIERLKKYSRHKIKNVYDKPDFPVDAVEVLQPDFEYADWAEERVNKLWKRSR